MFSLFLKSSFFLLILLGFHRTNGTNVTSVPTLKNLTVADLPPAIITPSVTKPAEIYPPPPNPSLYVQAGFTVKVYMTNLSFPRYLTYTPSGDILVSESASNRISCLVDNAGDGYPDERLSFADESNGLNYPYGMAFLDGYF